MPDLSVRPYQATDRAAVQRIAADTAFFGAPVEAFLNDRRLFGDAFYAYYTDVEPEHAWVACADGEVAGFLMGCVDTAQRQRRWIGQILPRVVWRALCGRYVVGKHTWRYAVAFLGALLRGELPHANWAVYPAHLHINVDARWRRIGLGQRLIEAYLRQLCMLQVSGVHLETTNLNEAACRLYTRMGFRLLDARPTRIWAHWVTRAVENRCYGLQLLEKGLP
jgi:ribosomal protein S18 acetylase RimI-like enzyme